MSTATLLVILGNALFVIACGTVGVRLVLKAARTRLAPELLLGSGLVLAVCGIPLLGVSGMGRLTVGELRLPLVVAGLTLLALSVVLQTAFVWRTFRPGRLWAMWLTAAIAAGAIGVMIMILNAIFSSAPEVPAATATRDAVFWLRIPFTASYAWTAVEGFMQFNMARRRERIQIGDPVITNRFMLWGSAGALACANTIVSSILHLMQVTPFNHPLGAATLGLGATLASVTLFLVFLPPDRYTRWIRSRNGLAAI